MSLTHVLCFWRRASQGILLECYTFGSPRVGDRRLASLHQAAVPSSFRVVYEGDIVPGFPRVYCGRCKVLTCCSPIFLCGNACGVLAEYKHCGIPVYLSAKGRGDLLLNPTAAERLVYLWWSRSFFSHGIENYIQAIEKVWCWCACVMLCWCEVGGWVCVCVEVCMCVLW